MFDCSFASEHIRCFSPSNHHFAKTVRSLLHPCVGRTVCSLPPLSGRNIVTEVSVSATTALTLTRVTDTVLLIRIRVKLLVTLVEMLLCDR